jgi:hypothetical protein
MLEALKPIIKFRRNKILDSAAIRDFYSLPRVATKDACTVVLLKLLINDQTIPSIMGKMTHQLEAVGNQPADLDDRRNRRPIGEVC